MAATSQFGEGFSLRAFLNAQLASVRVGDEQQVAELLRGLEERAAIVRDEADAATRDLVKVVAPCTRELTRTHAEAGDVREWVRAMAEEVATLEAGTHATSDFLGELETLKSRVERVLRTAEEVQNWDSRVLAVERHFEARDLGRTAEALASLRGSLGFMAKLPHYAKRQQELADLQRRAAAMAGPRVREALSQPLTARSAEELAVLVQVFAAIDQLDDIRFSFLTSCREAFVTLVSRRVTQATGRERGEAKLLVDAAVAAGPGEWLPGLLEEARDRLHQFAHAAAKLFPRDRLIVRDALGEAIGVLAARTSEWVAAATAPAHARPPLESLASILAELRAFAAQVSALVDAETRDATAKLEAARTRVRKEEDEQERARAEQQLPPDASAQSSEADAAASATDDQATKMAAKAATLAARKAGEAAEHLALLGCAADAWRAVNLVDFTAALLRPVALAVEREFPKLLELTVAAQWASAEGRRAPAGASTAELVAAGRDAALRVARRAVDLCCELSQGLMAPALAAELSRFFRARVGEWNAGLDALRTALTAEEPSAASSAPQAGAAAAARARDVSELMAAPAAAPLRGARAVLRADTLREGFAVLRELAAWHGAVAEAERNMVEKLEQPLIEAGVALQSSAFMRAAPSLSLAAAAAAVAAGAAVQPRDGELRGGVAAADDDGGEDEEASGEARDSAVAHVYLQCLAQAADGGLCDGTVAAMTAQCEEWRARIAEFALRGAAGGGGGGGGGSADAGVAPRGRVHSELLSDAHAAVESRHSALADAMVDALLAGARRLLRGLPQWPQWRQRPEHSISLVAELPSFSLQPSEPMRQTGELLIDLVQFLEPLLEVPAAAAAEAGGNSEAPVPPSDAAAGAAAADAQGKDAGWRAQMREAQSPLYWLQRVAGGLAQHLVDSVCRIPALSRGGRRQLQADVEYLSNVATAVGAAHLEPLTRLQALLRLSPEQLQAENEALSEDAPYKALVRDFTRAVFDHEDSQRA